MQARVVIEGPSTESVDAKAITVVPTLAKVTVRRVLYATTTRGSTKTTTPTRHHNHSPTSTNNPVSLCGPLLRRGLD